MQRHNGHSGMCGNGSIVCEVGMLCSGTMGTARCAEMGQ
jgi:hypothetical protein